MRALLTQGAPAYILRKSPNYFAGARPGIIWRQRRRVLPARQGKPAPEALSYSAHVASQQHHAS